MIVARVVTGVWNHAGARVTEWIGAIPLIGMGIVFLTGGDIFSISASFALLAAWATQGTWEHPAVRRAGAGLRLDRQRLVPGVLQIQPHRALPGFMAGYANLVRDRAGDVRGLA